jgi:hypothetical protein
MYDIDPFSSPPNHSTNYLFDDQGRNFGEGMNGPCGKTDERSQTSSTTQRRQKSLSGLIFTIGGR